MKKTASPAARASKPAKVKISAALHRAASAGIAQGIIKAKSPDALASALIAREWAEHQSASGARA